MSNEIFASEPFVDHPYSKDTRENQGLAHYVGFATKEAIEAGMWWEQQTTRSYLGPEAREQVIAAYAEQADQLETQAIKDFFEDQATSMYFEHHDSDALKYANQRIMDKMLSFVSIGYSGKKDILEFSTQPVHRFHELYEEYYKDGTVILYGYNDFEINGDVSTRVTDQLVANIYLANGCEAPEFTPADFKRQSGEPAGNRVATKRTPSSLPGVAFVEEERHVKKYLAKDPNNRFGHTIVRLVPEVAE